MKLISSIPLTIYICLLFSNSVCSQVFGAKSYTCNIEYEYFERTAPIIVEDGTYKEDFSTMISAINFSSKKFGFEILAGSYCQIYSFLDLKSRTNCPLVSHRYTQITELEQDFGCVLADELKNIIRNQEVIEYLVEVTKFVEEAKNNTSNTYNLWEWTLSRTSGERQKAIQWLAILFSDNTKDEYTLESNCLKKLKEINSGHLILQHYAKAMNAVYKHNIPKNIQLYPKAYNVENLGLYHFYVNAYMTSKFVQEGYDQKSSTLLPFFVNTLYEKYSKTRDPLSMFVSPVPDLDPNNTYSDYYSLRDIYLGYAGSLFALGKDNEIQSFDEFSREYLDSPQLWLGEYTQSL